MNMRRVYARGSPVSDSLPPLWRKRGTRKSGLETNTGNEARSALLARLWCHLILQNRANGAEKLTRLCSATIGQTGWRMVQVGYPVSAKGGPAFGGNPQIEK